MGTWNEAYKSGDYRNHWDYSLPSQELVSFIASGQIPKKGKCIDFGCGSGTETIFISSCGYETTGIDISKKALEIAKKKAREKGLRINWLNGNVLKSCFRSSSFNFINDRGCFHHITNDLRQQYADEAYRLLKPGGKILIRGCRKRSDIFQIINKKEINRFFNKKKFSIGPVLPIKLISDAGSLDSNIVVLTKI